MEERPAAPELARLDVRTRLNNQKSSVHASHENQHYAPGAFHYAILLITGDIKSYACHRL